MAQSAGTSQMHLGAMQKLVAETDTAVAEFRSASNQLRQTVEGTMRQSFVGGAGNASSALYVAIDEATIKFQNAVEAIGQANHAGTTNNSGADQQSSSSYTRLGGVLNT